MKFVPVPGTHVLFCTTETTVGDFLQFAREANYPLEDGLHFEQGEDHPVVNINREDARAFCDWLTSKERAAGLITGTQRYRLPESPEWSLAVGLISALDALGPLDQEIRNQNFYPWGEQWPPVEGAGNFAAGQIKGYDDAFEYTAPVGSFLPNEYGLHDMAGNAWEWCEGETRSGALQWVLRGGSWVYFLPDTLLAAYEYPVPDQLRAGSFGFRCVFDDPSLAPEVSRAILEARAGAREDAQSRILGRTGSDTPVEESPEEAEKRLQAQQSAKSRFLMRDKGEGSEGDADFQAERARLLERDLADSSEGDSNRVRKSRIRVRPEGVVARPGEPFLNSLGMKFLPLPGLPLLFGETEVGIGNYAEMTLQGSGPELPVASFRQSDEDPVVKVSWLDAAAFCEWLTEIEREAGWITGTQKYRMPTDAEWSRAAGLEAGSGETPAERGREVVEIFPWGDAWPPPHRAVNIDASKVEGYDDRAVYTGVVKGGEANALGFYGMGGNVSEWCWDNWDFESPEKVVRGGSWITNKREHLVSSYRQKLDPSTLLSNVGFRCVLVTE